MERCDNRQLLRLKNESERKKPGQNEEGKKDRTESGNEMMEGRKEERKRITKDRKK